jgi:hypothetical protein
MDINKDILRWVLLLAATPIWLPFLKMLWKDFNRALEEEGGVLGKPPTAQEAERIRQEKLSDPEILVSEPWARPGEKRAPKLRSPRSDGSVSSPGRAAGRSRRAGAGPLGSAPGAGEGKRGFRTDATKPGRDGERGGGFR